MVSNLRGRTYEALLGEVGMTSLADRRVRGDMIATYKIMTGKDKIDPGLFFDQAAEGPGPRTRTRRAAGVYGTNDLLVETGLAPVCSIFSQSAQLRMVSHTPESTVSFVGTELTTSLHTGCQESS